MYAYVCNELISKGISALSSFIVDGPMYLLKSVTFMKSLQKLFYYVLGQCNDFT